MLKLRIDTSGDAFQDYARAEVASILRQAANKVEEGFSIPGATEEVILRCSNGNAVGSYVFKESDE